MKKLLILLLFIFTFTFVTVHFSYSQDAANQQKNDLENKIAEYQKKLSELNQQKNTLASQVQYMDTQITITELRIQTTEEKIKTTQKEILILGDKITNLDNSLNHLSKLLLNRIAESYKKRSVSIFSLFFDSGNANDFLGQIKYLKTAQENNQKLLIQVQGTKSNFEEQKKLREQKKIDLDKLTITLNQQKQALGVQKDQKQKLLAATKNDELIYQGLLEKARQELAGYTSFTQSTGDFGCKSFGNGSNSWYFSQRDPQWCNLTLPGSSVTTAQAGCALTSVAMVCKNYGQSMNPISFVTNPSYFIGGDLWNWAFSCSGKTTDWPGTSKDAVINYVNNNTPVILRLATGGTVSGLHFVVAYAWDSGQNDFKIHDPYFGPDKFFSERYSWSNVTNAIVIH